MLPIDFDIFSPASCSIPLCIQSCANSWPSERDCATSFSWWGKTRSSPPPWISKTGPRCASAIAEHSMCQPGRPRPQGDSHHVSSPSLCAFQSAKSRGSSFSSLLGLLGGVARCLLVAVRGRRASRSRGSWRRESRRRRRPGTRGRSRRAPRSSRRSRGIDSVAFGSWSGRPSPRAPVSSMYQSLASSASLALSPGAAA